MSEELSYQMQAIPEGLHVTILNGEFKDVSFLLEDILLEGTDDEKATFHYVVNVKPDELAANEAFVNITRQVVKDLLQKAALAKQAAGT